MHCHINNGHGKCNPVLGLLAVDYAWRSSKLDATMAILLGGQEVPRTVLVGANVINDVISVGAIDETKGGAKTSRSITFPKLMAMNRHPSSNIALAEVLRFVLPRSRRTTGCTWFPHNDRFSKAPQLIERV